MNPTTVKWSLLCFLSNLNGDVKHKHWYLFQLEVKKNHPLEEEIFTDLGNLKRASGAAFFISNCRFFCVCQSHGDGSAGSLSEKLETFETKKKLGVEFLSLICSTKKKTFNERPLHVLCVSPMVMLRMSQHEMDDKMQRALAIAEKSSLGIIPLGSMYGWYI